MNPSPPLRRLTKITDLSPTEIDAIVENAFSYKKTRDHNQSDAPILKGKTIALVFEKPSLRTKVAFETAIASLGGTAVFLAGVEIFKRVDGVTREKTSDIAHVLERYCDAIVARVHSHQSILEMAECVSIPVINALCDLHHPTQGLADLMAIRWHKPNQKKLKIAFVGDGSNVAVSLFQSCIMAGFDCVHGGHAAYKIPDDIWQETLQLAKQSGGSLSFTLDPKIAARDADVIYADTFVSMGDEAETTKRLKDLAPYCVTEELMSLAKPDAIFLHDLPAHRREEVTAGVFDGPQSKVFDLAECRMHAAKALLEFFLPR